MYTCLRFVGEVKEEYIDEIEMLFNANNGKETEWKGWEHFAYSHPFAEPFSKLWRADFIPFGAMTYYNRDKFTSVGDIDTLTFSNVIEERTWVFQCDLKDYDGEIDMFLETIAKEICDRFIATIWYEEWDFPQLVTYGLEKDL